MMFDRIGKDVQDFIGVLLFAFFFPIAFMGGMVSGYFVLVFLICDVAKVCEVQNEVNNEVKK